MEGKHKINVDDFKVGSLPTLMYIPDFITLEEQAILLNNVLKLKTLFLFLIS